MVWSHLGTSAKMEEAVSKWKPLPSLDASVQAGRLIVHTIREQVTHQSSVANPPSFNQKHNPYAGQNNPWRYGVLRGLNHHL